MMHHVLVIGSPGAGKSTLSRALSAKLDLPLFYLDMLYHKPDRSTVSQEEFDAHLAKILPSERWIIDGNYARTLEMRLRAADTVILLDYPLELCLEGIRSRIGKQRPDLPWLERELDPEFCNYVKQFPHVQLPKIYSLLDRFKDEKRVIVLHSREECNSFLQDVCVSFSL